MINAIAYTQFVRSRIEEGQKDIDEGSLLTHDEVKIRLEYWLDKQADTWTSTKGTKDFSNK